MESGLNFDVWLFRLVMAVVLGGIVGFERQYRGRPAGLRTHILVCLGATLITLAGVCLVAGKQQPGEAFRTDPARVAAGVITGIGFLGAGTIIRDPEGVKGLTTAASLWVVAAIGLAVGCGFIKVATYTTVLVLIVLHLLRYIENRIFSAASDTINRKT